MLFCGLEYRFVAAIMWYYFSQFNCVSHFCLFYIPQKCILLKFIVLPLKFNQIYKGDTQMILVLL